MSSEHQASGPQASRPGSSVLARMIQRSREPQSSLEPVIQPRFPPGADGFTLAGGPAPDALSPEDNRLPPHGYKPVTPETLADEGSPPAGHGYPPGHGGLTPTAGATQPRFPPGADGFTLAGGPAADALSPEDGAPEDSAPAGHGYPLDSGGVTPATHELPSAADGLGSATAAFAADDEPAPPTLGPLARQVRAISGLPETFRAAEGEDRSRQHRYRSVPSAPGEPVGGATATNPSVTITIGHIEVRPVPSPQRPARQEAPQRPRPSFRPRTTLADFLDDGAGRPGGSGRR
jgi:hypothetical protein